MKKFIVFILAIMYLGLSTGATVHMHFCMGKFVGSSLWNNEKSELCSKCGMEKKASKNKCCNDETKVVKIEQDQKVTIPLDHSVEVTSIELIQNSFITPTFFRNASTEEAFLSNAPPLVGNAPIYLRNCDFRI